MLHHSKNSSHKMNLKKPIQIFARLKPTAGPTEPYPYDIEKIDSDGTNDEILVFNMKTNTEEGYYAHKPQENQRFRYSKVFNRDATQKEIFDRICKPVIDGALSGYNGTIFAYGQTGSGKTYTMTGSRAAFEDRGIIPRTLSYLFQKFKQLGEGKELLGVYISYLEIYNENGYDLLHTANGDASGLGGRFEDMNKVILMEDAQQQTHLRHLSVNPVEDEDQAMHLFYMGEHQRTIAETPMNEASTRSHCIFTIHVHTREITGTMVRKSKIHLVDLAGSERIANSNISGQLFNEARHINLALHYLEQVIVALGEANRTHIPYRNSMMTSILRDSLGGNCMTSMIATLSLELRNIPETLSTCRFSQRVALVTNDACLNEEVDSEFLIVQLKAEIKRLKGMMANATKIAENVGPVTEEEFEECCTAVHAFLMDSDEDSVLSVPPEMRLIQKCFQCLKFAYNGTPAKLGEKMVTLPAKSYCVEIAESSTPEKQIQKLLATLASRDHEIKVLSRKLKETQENNRNGKLSIGMNSPNGSPQKSPRSSRKNEKLFNQPNTVEPYNDPKPSVRPPSINFSPMIDKESLILEGFTETKKKALENFLSTYSGKSQLDHAKEQLLQHRSNLEKLKEDMNNEHAQLNKMKRTLINVADDEEAKSNTYVLKEVCATHERTLAMKEKRLIDARRLVEDSQEIVKRMYGRMIEAFENSFDLSNDRINGPMKNIAAGVFKRNASTTEQPEVNSDDHFKPSFSEQPNDRLPPSSTPRKKLKDNPESSTRSGDKSKDNSPRIESYDSLLGDRMIPKPRKIPLLSANEEDTKACKSNNENKISDNCPVTGDPSTDREILNFIAKRQAVFRLLAEEKSTSSNSLPGFEKVANKLGTGTPIR